MVATRRNVIAYPAFLSDILAGLYIYITREALPLATLRASVSIAATRAIALKNEFYLFTHGFNVSIVSDVSTVSECFISEVKQNNV